MKQTIRLTESKLRNIIRESVKKCLYEEERSRSIIDALRDADPYFGWPDSYVWPLIEEKYGSDENFARDCVGGTYYGNLGDRDDICSLADSMWYALADDLSQKYKVNAEYDGEGHIEVNGHTIDDEEELSKLCTESIRRRRRR